MKWRERPFVQIPVVIRVLLLLVITLQLAYASIFRPDLSARFRQLDIPADDAVYQVASLGSERLLSYLLTLELQLHDAQEGVHVPYARLDFERLSEWLLTLYRLNPLSDYPAFLASRVYSQNPDDDKVRAMISVIERLFEADPRRHWRRMTEAVLLAKHRLRDLPLALDLARQVAQMPVSIETPRWARDMEIIVLDEIGEKEAALRLISSLLHSGAVTDRDERRFLEQRLLKIQQALSNDGQIAE